MATEVINNENANPEILNNKNANPAVLISTNEKEREFHPRIKEHELFDNPQKWYIDVKTDSMAPSYCASCNGTIILGDLLLYSYGILYLPSRDKVVKTKLRFCPEAECVGNVKGANHNITDISEGMQVVEGKSVFLSGEEEELMAEKGFTIVKL